MKSQNYELKKSQIFLNCTELFVQKGFVNTTLENILQQASISKGTFYHYFHSKEALLDELTNDLFDNLVAQINEILANNKISVAAKLNQILLLPVELKLGKEQRDTNMFEFIQIEGNQDIRRKFEAAWHEHLNPLVCQLFEQGNKSGIMNVSNPSQMATLIIQLGINLRLYTAQDVGQQDKATMTAYQQCMERTLAMPANSLSFSAMELV